MELKIKELQGFLQSDHTELIKNCHNDKDEIISAFIHCQHPYLQILPLIDKTEMTIPFYSPIEMFLLSPRKSHEVNQLYQYISNQLDSEVEFLIEFGSGMGHVSRIFKKKFSHLNVICIERDVTKLKKAKKLDLIIGGSDDDGNVLYVESIDDPKVDLFVKSRQKSNMKKPKGMIIGLDVCGEFPDEILELFIKNLDFIDVKECFIVPCCFHKIKKIGDDCLVCDQDLMYLNNEETIKKYEFEQNDDSFPEWCFAQGVISRVWESLITYERIEYLYKNGVGSCSLEIVFEFEVSSRNVMIRARK